MKVYNKIAPWYDFMIDWEARIRREDPFFLHLFAEQLSTSILDLGCGTGEHALHWAEMGYNLVGIDSAKEMIDIAAEKAKAMDLDADFLCLPITDFASTLQQQFDMVICLGNTVSHLLDEFNLKKCFHETARSLKPTGLAVFHLLNYHRILEMRLRDFPVKHKVVEDKEYVFLRFYNYQDKVLEFNYIVAIKENGQWTSKSYQMLHRPWLLEELTALALESGFHNVMSYGGYAFEGFETQRSEDLVLVCDFTEE